jgi:hypothetical protein
MMQNKEFTARFQSPPVQPGSHHLNHIDQFGDTSSPLHFVIEKTQDLPLTFYSFNQQPETGPE